MTREEKRALWGQRISSYKASGLNAEQWCSIHDLPLATLRYWLGRQNRQAKPQEKTEVQWLLLDETPASGALEPICTNEKEVRIQVGKTSVFVGRDFSEEALVRVLKVLHAYA